VTFGGLRASRRVRELELAEDVVSQMDGVREGLELDAVLAEPRNGRDARDRAEGDDKVGVAEDRLAVVRRGEDGAGGARRTPPANPPPRTRTPPFASLAALGSRASAAMPAS
jgi:hypothetical protein